MQLKIKQIVGLQSALNSKAEQLNDLNDVGISSVSDGDYLRYNSGTGDWENVSVSVGGLGSIDGVSNDGGNVDLISSGAISISPDDTNNEITISETHSSLTNNPHNVNKSQVGLGNVPNVNATLTSNISHNSDLSAAINKNLKDLLDNFFVTPEMFGTVDGTNDHIQVQAAVDAVVNKGGGVVRLKRGGYTFGAEVTINYNRIIIVGEGPAVTQIEQTASETPCFRFVPNNPQTDDIARVGLKDVSLITNETDPTTSALVIFDRVKNSFIDNVYTVGGYRAIEVTGVGQPFYINNCNLIYKGFTVSQPGSAGIAVTRRQVDSSIFGASQDSNDSNYYTFCIGVFISNTDQFGVGNNGWEDNVRVEHVDGLYASNSHFGRSLRASVAFVARQDNLLCQNVLFDNILLDPTDNSFAKTDYGVIFTDDGLTSVIRRDIAFANCSIAEAVVTGIFVATSVEDMTWTGGNIKKCGEWAIRVNEGKNITFADINSRDVNLDNVNAGHVLIDGGDNITVRIKGYGTDAWQGVQVDAGTSHTIESEMYEVQNQHFVAINNDPTTTFHNSKSDRSTSIFSSSTLNVPPEANVVNVTGTININAISTDASYNGHEVTLIFNGDVDVNNGNNLSGLSNAFLAADGSKLTIICRDGTWYETITRDILNSDFKLTGNIKIGSIDNAPGYDIDIEGTSPSIGLRESDVGTTNNIKTLAITNQDFIIQTRDNNGTVTSQDYQILTNGNGLSGVYQHRWNIDGSRALTLSSTGLSVNTTTAAQALTVGGNARITNNRAILEFSATGAGTDEKNWSIDATPAGGLDFRTLADDFSSGAFPLALTRNGVSPVGVAIRASVLAKTGSSSNLAYTFENDQGVGFYNNATNNITVVTGSTNRFTFDENGRLGGGTTTPNTILDLRPIPFSASNSGGIQIGTTDNSLKSRWQLELNASGVPSTILYTPTDISGSLQKFIQAEGNNPGPKRTMFFTDQGEEFRSEANSVRIGTTTKIDRLTVDSAIAVQNGSGSQIRLRSTAAGTDQKDWIMQNLSNGKFFIRPLADDGSNLDFPFTLNRDSSGTTDVTISVATDINNTLDVKSTLFARGIIENFEGSRIDGTDTAISDDNVLTISLSQSTDGVVTLYLAPHSMAIFTYRMNSSSCAIQFDPDNKLDDSTTGALTGTTGPDNSINVSAANGTVYIENRSGGNIFPSCDIQAMT